MGKSKFTTYLMKLLFIMQRNIKSHSFLYIAEELQKFPLLPDDTCTQLISIHQLHLAANMKYPPNSGICQWQNCLFQVLNIADFYSTSDKVQK